LFKPQFGGRKMNFFPSPKRLVFWKKMKKKTSWV